MSDGNIIQRTVVDGSAPLSRTCTGWQCYLKAYDLNDDDTMFCIQSGMSSWNDSEKWLRLRLNCVRTTNSNPMT